MITREELDKQIKENGVKEWRSYKEFREYLDRNYKVNDFKIIGWVSPETRKKWFKDGLKEITRPGDFINTEDLWILTRGNNYWFVRMFALDGNNYDYSKTRI